MSQDASGTNENATEQGGGNKNNNNSNNNNNKNSNTKEEKDKKKMPRYSAERVIGSGSFGVVYKAMNIQSKQVVAIKKVREDRRYKNRELQIMKVVRHPNIVTLQDCFYSKVLFVLFVLFFCF